MSFVNVLRKKLVRYSILHLHVCIPNTISWTLKIQTVKKVLHTLQIRILNMDGKNYSLKDYFWHTKKTMVLTLKLQDSITSTDLKEHGMVGEKKHPQQCVEKLQKQKMEMRLKFGVMVIRPVLFYTLMNVLERF